MRKQTKSSIIFTTFLFTFGLSLVTVITFMIAFFNGYEAPFVFINLYGEAIPEFIILVVLIPIMLYGLWLSYKDVKDGVDR